MELALRTSMLVPIMLVLIFFMPAVHSEPFVPVDDDQILATLPSGFAEIARRARSRQYDSNDYHAAVELSEKYIALGRAEADPRFYGYAQATLAPWWELSRPPVEILVLRAVLKQARHEFELALNDLDLAIEQEPYNARAWLTRSVILRVRGNYPQAMQSCSALQGLTQALVIVACMSSVAGLDSRAEQAYQLLAARLENIFVDTDNNVKLWALTIAAELAEALGKSEAAEKHFQEALAMEIRNNYLLSAYSDFLLDQGRAQEVYELLKEETAADGNLLRLILAEQQLGLASIEQHKSMLWQRIEANRQRGDRSHLREEARAMLHIFDRPDEALLLAQENWTMQREPWDARLVLEAALATGKSSSANEVLNWVARTELQHVRLLALVENLRTPQ